MVGKNLRTGITLGIIILYAACYHLYIFELTHLYWDIHYLKLFYLYINLGLIIFYIIDRKVGLVGGIHKGFNSACINFIILNHLIWIANWHGFLGDPSNPIAANLFSSFYIGVALVTIMFLISGIRHKIFE